MDNTAARYRHYRVRSFVIMWFVYAGYYLTRKNYAVAKSGIMKAHGLNEMQIAPIGGAFLALYTVGQFANGILGDKVGARVMLSLGMIVSAFMSLWFGFTSSVVLMTLLWAANGYFQATGWSNCVKSMSQWFSMRERGVVMGWYCTCYQIGSALATMFAAYALGRWGWQSAFSVPAVVLLLIAAAYILFHKDTPERAGLPPIAEYHGEKPETAASLKEAGENSLSHRDVVRRVASNPMVWLLGFSYFCLKFIRYSLMMWLPLYMTKELGYAPAKSGWLSAVPEFAGFMGCIFAGYVSDRVFGSRRAPICALMFVGLIIGCIIQTRLCLMGTVPMVVGLSFIFFMIFGPDSIMSGAAAMDFGTREGAATAAGIINGCGSLGTVIQEFALGYIAVNFGYQYFFHIFIPFSIIPFFLMLSQWNTRPKGE